MRPSPLRLSAFALAALTTTLLLAATAGAVHWPLFGGDNGRSGYQPVDEGGLPVTFAYSKDEPAIKTSILTTTGAPADQRVIFGRNNGEIHLQALATGAPIGPEGGTNVDEGLGDSDVFGTRSTTPGANGASVSFADTSTAAGLGQVFVVHNDDSVAGPLDGVGDIQIAQIDEASGVRGRTEADIIVPGSDGFTISSSVVATGPAGDGSRTLYFVVSNGTVEKLYRVPITGDARQTTSRVDPTTITDTTNAGIADLNANPLASPTIFFRDLGGISTAFVAVGTTTGVATFVASNLQPGPSRADLGGPGQTPIVPVQPSGATPGPGQPVTTAPFLYVAVASGTSQTTVHKLRNDTTLTSATAPSDPLAGGPAPGMATSQESEPTLREGRLIVTTGSNLYLLSTQNLARDGAFSSVALSPGTTGFRQTVAAASGDFIYVTNDRAEQIVLRLSDAQRVSPTDFTRSATNTGADNTGVGQPSISRGFIQFAGGNGLFVYRNADVSAPIVTLTAPAENATLAAVARLMATASDTRNAVRVDFRFDGQIVASDATPEGGTTFAVDFDTRLRPNGSALIDAVATDAAGRQATSAPRRVTINNNAPAGDRPPSVRFVSPRESAVLRRATRVELSAADDKGVTKVTVRNGSRVLCVDTTVPFECTFTPRAAEIGQNTLFAIATDSGNQTGSASRMVRVAPLTPRRVTIRATPSRDRRAPYKFTARGTVLLPAGITRAQACGRGEVSVKLRGRRTVSSKRVRLSSKCTFRTSTVLRSKRNFGKGGRLKVVARFTGNDVIGPRSAPGRYVRGG